MDNFTSPVPHHEAHPHRMYRASLGDQRARHPESSHGYPRKDRVKDEFRPVSLPRFRAKKLRFVISFKYETLCEPGKPFLICLINALRRPFTQWEADQ